MKKLKKSLNTLNMLNRDDMKRIVGGYGETKKYCCTVSGGGWETYYWTCYAPSVSMCKNPIGAGTSQSCVEC